MRNPFEMMHKDIIRIINKDGKTSADLKVLVESKMNFYHLDVNVEKGDVIERDLPNEKKERYHILDVEYNAGLGPIPAHYILKISKSPLQKASLQAKNIFNLTGPNSRVYQHSYDHSYNVVTGSTEETFDQLKKVIDENIVDKATLLNLLEEMKQEKGNDNYLSIYTSFIAAAANHMTLIAPFIPSLTAFIHS